MILSRRADSLRAQYVQALETKDTDDCAPYDKDIEICEIFIDYLECKERMYSIKSTGDIESYDKEIEICDMSIGYLDRRERMYSKNPRLKSAHQEQRRVTTKLRDILIEEKAKLERHHPGHEPLPDLLQEFDLFLWQAIFLWRLLF